MNYLFYIVVVAAAFHFLWESILAPSFRCRLRFELFELRDELRWLHHQQPSGCDLDAFRYLQSAVNNGLRLLPRADFTLLRSVHNVLENDEALCRRIERRRQLIESSGSAELKAVQKRLQKITCQAFAINTGGWMIYVIPIVCAFASLGGINRFIKNTILIPESELDKVAPMPGMAWA